MKFKIGAWAEGDFNVAFEIEGFDWKHKLAIALFLLFLLWAVISFILGFEIPFMPSYDGPNRPPVWIG